jgi:hypothetical protein
MQGESLDPLLRAEIRGKALDCDVHLKTNPQMSMVNHFNKSLKYPLCDS